MDHLKDQKNLENLLCASNNFTSFDFSGMQYFKEFIASNNQLVSVNIANGNNANMGTNYVKTDNNPNLTCIEVDDVNYSTTNWLNVDGTATFSLNCSNGVEENVMSELVVFPNPTKNQLYFKGYSESFEVSVYDIIGNTVLNSTVDAASPLDVSKLQSGIYILKFNDYNSTFKFVKE